MENTQQQEAFIKADNIKKAFGQKQILDGFSFDVKRGESLVIVGGSGTGKSVSLKCMLGLLEADSGTITLDGQDITHLNYEQRRKVNKRIGMLFQHAALFDSLSVWRNVAFGLIEGQGMDHDKAYKIAIEKLEQVGMRSDIAQLSPAELSGGMRKRVGLARAIAIEPEILFFDEPTTGLDPIMGHIIDDLIRKCVKEVGACAVTITHDMNSVRRIADKLVMLFQGKDIWHGRVDELDSTDNEYVAQFLNGHIDGPIKMQLRK